MRALVVLAVLAAGCAQARPADSAAPVRAVLLGDPVVGSEAPPFSLPYVRAEGPGPADQPFVLRSELGRVVILALIPEPSDSGAVALVRGLVRERPALEVGDLVQLVYVITVTPGRAVEYANRHGLQDKVLIDSTGSVRRLFGVSQRDQGLYVVGGSGRISWRSTRANPYSAVTYRDLADAVRRARWETPDW